MKRGVLYIENRLDKITADSCIFKLIEAVITRARAGFKYSFFGRISQVNGPRNMSVLADSRSAKFSIHLYDFWKSRIRDFARPGSAANFIKVCGKKIYSFCLVNAGSILIIAVLSNIFFLLVLHKRIFFTDWAVRALLLLIGLAGLSYRPRPREILRSSFLLKYIMYKGQNETEEE
ncbi:MAG: hypothetical protein Q8O22_00835 [Candidatus Omnitrophota bacterium]|nr:hypothetical protein [Candidatus Omnitrophota bacterium]